MAFTIARVEDALWEGKKRNENTIKEFFFFTFRNLWNQSPDPLPGKLSNFVLRQRQSRFVKCLTSQHQERSVVAYPHHGHLPGYLSRPREEEKHLVKLEEQERVRVMRDFSARDGGVVSFCDWNL
jgi:hypothetical protein